MDFQQCYQYIGTVFYEHDFSDIGKNFSALITIKSKESNYIFLSYIDGQKYMTPKCHKSANIFLTMSIETFEEIVNGSLDSFKAFTTGKIQAKGNVVLAMSIYNSFK